MRPEVPPPPIATMAIILWQGEADLDRPWQCELLLRRCETPEEYIRDCLDDAIEHARELMKEMA